MSGAVRDMSCPHGIHSMAQPKSLVHCDCKFTLLIWEVSLNSPNPHTPFLWPWSQALVLYSLHFKAFLFLEGLQKLSTH